MSSAARIEELQKKFDENPRRYFAPLANECRKAGDLDAAIAICRAHLPQQPGHMSGHIVYGQALFEAGELAEARTVFETALGLDPENLIALRHMGDIAAREGDAETARQWYTRVLDSDPRNEEVQALLAGLGGAAPAEGDLPTFIEPALVAAAAEASEPTETQAEPAEIVFAEEAESFETAPPALERSEELLDFEPTSFGSAPAMESPGERPTMGEPAAGLEPSETVPPADSFTLDGFEATSFELPPAQPAQPTSPAPAAPLDLDMTGFGATGLEPTSLSIPAAPEPDAFVTETMAELYLQQGYRDRALDVYRQLIEQSPGDMGLRERMARVEREGASVVSEPFATEAVDTGMPELIDERLEVPAPSPGSVIHGLPTAMEPALVAAAAEGASAATGPVGPTIREYLAAIALGQPVPDLQAGPDATAALAGIPLLDTGGEIAEVVAIDEALVVASQPAAAAPRSEARTGLDSLFGAPHETGDVRAADVLSDAYAPPAPPAPPAAAYDDADANPLSGRPARPAGNDLSLDHVFGQPRQSGPAKPTGSFSFDQFFADGAVKTPREESSEPEPRNGSDDDIEQFNSWLKGLKNK